MATRHDGSGERRRYHPVGAIGDAIKSHGFVCFSEAAGQSGRPSRIDRHRDYAASGEQIFVFEVETVAAGWRDA